MTRRLHSIAALTMTLSLAACSSDPEPTAADATDDVTEDTAPDVIDEPVEPEGITLTAGTPSCNAGSPYVASQPIGGELAFEVNDVASSGDFVSGHIVFAARLDFVACETVDFGDVFMFSIVAPESGFAPGQTFDIAAGEATFKVDAEAGFTTATSANGASGTLTLEAWDGDAGTFTITGTIDGPDLAPAHVTFRVLGVPPA